MKKIVLAIAATASFVFGSVSLASPWTLLSDVSYVQKGGVDALRVDFTIPVHYVAHFPARHGEELSIVLRFDKNEVKDISELPLLESINAPDSDRSPVHEVTYMTDKHQRPVLKIRFKHDVNFNVSQVMGIKSLVIFMPDEKLSVVEPSPFESSPLEKSDSNLDAAIPDPGISGSADVIKLKQQFRSGRTALRKRQYKKAIGIFSALLSLPKHELSKASLELLGVSRERNNQAAHAKAIYQRYLKQYPLGDDAVRVKQRLADLIQEQMKPRAKLEDSRSKRVSRKDSSRINATLSQYLDYRDSKVLLAGASRQVHHTGLDNHLNVNWRIRKGDWDIRNYFFGNFEYETVSGDTDGFEVGTMYSKIRNSHQGLSLTVGRQSGSTTGVLGRFDGLLLGYRLHPQIRTNMVLGYPVDIGDKTSIQTDQPMAGFNVEFNDVIRGWDITPFYIQQETGPLMDRRAVGGEFSYFDKNRGNFFSLLDYDINFGDWNLALFQGQYTAFKPTSINLYMDYRKSPNLQMTNALLNAGITTEQLVRQFNEEEIQNIAEDRTGRSRIVTLGVSHDFSDKVHFVADISRSDSLSKIAPLVVTDKAVTDKSKQVDVSALLIVEDWLEPKDTLLLNTRRTDGSDFVTTVYSGSYRYFYQSLYRVEPKIAFKDRKSSNGSRLIKRVPGLKVQYRAQQNLRYYMEFSLESQSGNTPGSSSRSVNYYIGYSWDFL
ncbi:MAG: hypothetical protein OEZ68_02775 [Gammaproteobacteria bacterium]|nr:hypothetical protein [Gammaproteobacteria bacterium]MDH5799705.1 hypothetical protein [Gammaproteobacteria bacterium]